MVRRLPADELTIHNSRLTTADFSNQLALSLVLTSDHTSESHFQEDEEKMQMKEMLKKAAAPAMLVAALILSLASVGDGRGSRHRSINQRQGRQQTRIKQGVRNGELTRRETVRLEQQQAAIATREGFARRSGGEFTAEERARIQRQQNQASQNIYQQKHDRQDRNEDDQ